MVKVDFSSIRGNIEEGNIDDALRYIEKIENLNELSVPVLIEYHSIKFEIYLHKGEYDKCVRICDDLITLSHMIQNHGILIDSLILKGEALWQWNKLDDLLLTVESGESVLFGKIDVESRENIIQYLKLKRLKGAYYRFKGELDLAYAYFSESLSMAEKLEDDVLIGLCLNALGLIHLDRGEYDDARTYLHQSEQMRKFGRDKIGYSTTLFNLGRLYENLGEINHALNYFTQCLEIAEKHNYIRNIALAKGSLGLLYNKLNDPDLAIQYLNDSLVHYQSLDNEYYIAKIIFDIIRVYALNNRLAAIQPFLEHIEVLHNQYKSNAMISLYYRLSMASFNKSANRLKLRATAQKVFSQIAHEEILDYSLFVYAALNLTDMLLTELKFSTNKDVLDELLGVIVLLRVDKKNSVSSSLLIESYILEAKLARMEFKINSAYEMLNKAYELSLEKNLKQMQIKVSKEYDELLGEFQEESQDSMQSKSLFERMENAELETYLANLMSARIEKLEYKTDQPLLLLITDKDQNTLYSKILSKEKSIDDEYMSALLTTINSFLGEVIVERGEKLDRLKHGDAYILMQRLNDLILFYCFESESSFSGIDRFNNLIDMLKSIQDKSGNEFQNIFSNDDSINEIINTIF